jgi:EDD domain protein, DegV family
MRLGLLVDAACDLPPALLRERGVAVLPIPIRCGGERFLDQRAEDQILAFYRGGGADRSDAESSPLSVEEMRDFMLEHLVTAYDFVFAPVIGSSRSAIFTNARSASMQLLRHCRQARAAAGATTPFMLRVLDTQNVLAGEAITALEALRRIDEGWTPQRIRQRLQALIPMVHGYMVPRDLYHLRARAKRRGDRSVGWWQYAFGSALDLKPVIRARRNDTRPVARLRHFEDAAQRCFGFLCRRLRAGLATPDLVLSYAGDPQEIDALPGCAEMLAVAGDCGVRVHRSVMSITGGIHVGAGALAFAFAAEDHAFDA